MSLDAGGDSLGRRRHHHYSSSPAPLVLCYLVLISASNPVSPPVTIGCSKSSVCLNAAVSFAARSPFHHNLSRCATSRVQTFATASARRRQWRSHLISRLRRRQNHMKPLLSVMLSLWLFVLCSADPVSFPAMAVNCFSGESPSEIYSGAFRQPVWARFAFVPPWRCLLTSSNDLSASVKPSVTTACFSCSRSFQSVRKSESLLSLSFIDFIDQRFDFGFGKFLWLQHGNVGSESICMDSMFASSESIEKIILMSVDVKVKRSVLTNLYHSYLHSIVLGSHHPCFMRNAKSEGSSLGLYRRWCAKAWEANEVRYPGSPCRK
ncbi:Uncharacterized protein Rs2_09862 [Raphanus sativus]|nr:hypothetical protein Rs2_46325 [Raphanus sativus]KAJ4906204.1 Uncharacterized protein Rs2_09862 [Raphanus sativus]